MQRYYQLAKLLSDKTFHIYITGSHREGQQMKQECPEIFDLPHVFDVTGHYDLEGLIKLIESADCLVASGTGPVHIAAAADVLTIGLYPPTRPIHPGRWGPIGRNVITLCKGKICNDQKNKHKYMHNITSKEVYNAILYKLSGTHDKQ